MLGALLVLTIAWLFVRIRQNKAATEAESRPSAKDSGTFHAVAIKYSENACDAAKAMTGRRFLSNAAPRYLHPLVQLVLQAAFKKTEGRRLTAAKKTISMIGKASPAV